MREPVLLKFKPISLPKLILRRLNFKTLAYVLCLNLFGAVPSQALQKGHVELGPFASTFYWVVNENSYPVGQDAEIKNMSGSVIAKVHSLFKKDLAMEGTGILRNGRTINFAGRVGTEVRYRFTSNRWGWGIGRCPLIPFRTIAVDPNLIPLGTTVYIPAMEGMQLPDGTTHDGIVQAEDIGSAINNRHIDLFAQEGVDSTSFFKNAGIKSGANLEVYKVQDPDPKGCHTLEPEEGPSRHTVSAHLEALVELADEYSMAGQVERSHLALQKAYELRSTWEGLGRPIANPRLKNYFVKQERRLLDSTLVDGLGVDVLSSRYPNEVNGQNLSSGKVVLTFDDGPHETHTPEVVEILSKEGMHGAFFQVGEMVAKLPQHTRLIAQKGHVLANHSYTHENLINLPDDQVSDQITSTQEVIQRAMGGSDAFNDYFQLFFSRRFPMKRVLQAPEFFRSPFGSRNENTMKIVGSIEAGSAYAGGKSIPQKLLHVMWNVDSLDWKDRSPQSIEARVFRVLAQHGNRGVILFHDIHPQTVEAIRLILPRLKREGFQTASLYDLH